MKRRFGYAALLLLALLPMPAWCADVAKGKATIYSDSFCGKRTATGAIYNKHALSAASPTLPLGSTVAVTNRRNGKRMLVKINDRQPKGGGRVLDLSRAAANRLGVKGTAPVQARVVSKGGVVAQK